MIKDQLTPKQHTLLGYLKQAIQQTGSAPSLRAAAADLGISHAAVAQTLKTLEEKRYIRRQGRYSRTIHLLDTPSPSAMQRLKQIPVIGNITAGLPMYAQQEWDDSILLDEAIYPGPDLFALKVQGFSMKNAGIFDQDIAVCRPRQYARNREIVVALIHSEEATIKRFFLHDNAIELRPENPEFDPQFYDFDDILIQGKVIGIMRSPQGMEE